MATGWGFDQNVKDAYRFIVDNYQRAPRGPDGKRVGEDDRIYIFGFSRGAYSARVLAGFIHALGIVSKYHVNLIDYAYRTYKGIPDIEQTVCTPAERATDDAPSAFTSMRLYERTLKTYRPKIKLLGLFDTVASIIESGKWMPQLKTLPFTNTNPSVEWVRQALAIDERRTMFNPMPWAAGQEYWGGPFRPANPEMQNSKEVWFTGVHGDVGGGYPEKESAIIKIPLEWMIRETMPTGLDYSQPTIDKIVLGDDPKEVYVKLDPLAKMHDSMTAMWKVLECVPRRVPETSWKRRGNTKGIYIPFCDHRLIPDGAIIHQSVIERKEGRPMDGPYAPLNFPSRYGVERGPASITS
ncbi:DUF2235 domain-containing protein [Rhizobium sp. L245/93]|uniref:T6SS phospholipase effector Tle1-like catalytic domain-containing protein n=1 Tax=Rhizobium sp. L245/93 TaxID=2819998 RepID=UPI0032AEB2CC